MVICACLSRKHEPISRDAPGARAPDLAEGRVMQSQNRFFDDLARVTAGAMGTLSGLKGEVESRIREQLERVLAGMDLVSREEFEAVKAMAARARSEQEDLAKRMAELESRLTNLAAAGTRPNPADGGQTSFP
jgi:BMFP domain-containing protein YqiC